MLKHVTIQTNNLDPSSWTEHDVEDVIALLVEKFPGSFPDTARIYHESVCQSKDVTPGAETVDIDIAKLQSLPGPFFVVVFPEAQALPYIIAVILAVASYVLAPGVPKIAAHPPQALARNQQAASPNNELSDRTNRARINGRIPDIYGTVRSTPDLIAVPYKVFENNREVEFAYMCIGRGPYVVSSIRDGETQVVNIGGSSVMIYDPYTSPNSYDPTNPSLYPPVYVAGQLRHERVLSAKRSNSVNGQVLRPPNQVGYNADPGLGGTQLRFRFPNIIEMPEGSPQDFTKFFVEGDIVTIADAVMGSDTIVASLGFKAGKGNITYNYPGGTKTFNCNDGALLFPASQADMLTTVFASSTVDLDTNSVTSIGDIDGTYSVGGTSVEGPTTAAERAAGIPSFFIVRLTSPASVNSNWNNIANGSSVGYSSFFSYTPTGFDIDLDGEGYEITSISKETITLDNPAAIAADWNTVLSVHTVTPFLNASIIAEGPKWVGPFILDDTRANQVFCNFVASNGLYKDDGTDQTAGEVEVELELTPVDLADAPLADSQTFKITLIGSTFLKETVAVTLKATPSAFYGRMAVRARRLTEADREFNGTVVDEVRWRDVYSIAPVSQSHFGNVTTVMSVTLATASALAVKERKLNMLVQRRIPTFALGEFTDILMPTNDAALILAAICRDQYIGNRDVSELDTANFFDTATEVETYFGTARVREFNYTFDREDVSFEEMIETVAKALFSVAYRRGSVIRLSFEKETEDSTLLFNHRNKIPGTEKRAISFGNASSDNDGIEYTYVDPRDDSINTIFLPPDRAAINPKKIESIGIRDHLAGYFHAWRIWNRMLFQNTTVEFDATQEADLLVVNDRILVSDGTRPNIQDGEVDAISGTQLTLSQSVALTPDPSYTIFLQHFDASVEAIAITAGTNANQVVLAGAPLMDLVTAKDRYAKTTFLIVGANDVTQKAFLVSEKSAAENMISTVQAVNYSAGYYANDKDFINEIIDENGYGEPGGYTPGDGGGYVPPIHAPFLVAALIEEDTVGLDWDALIGATVDAYKIYRSASGANNFILIHTNAGDDLDYTDVITPGNYYDYRVDGIVGTPIGIAYPSNIASLFNFANVSLLVHFNDGVIEDDSNYGYTVNPINGMTTTTTNPKFGTTCGETDGDNYCSVEVTSPLALGGGDFTIECWARFNDIADYYTQAVWGFGDSTNGERVFRLYAQHSPDPLVGMQFTCQCPIGIVTPGGNWNDIDQSIPDYVAGDWVFLSVCRQGTKGFLGVNGVVLETTEDNWQGNPQFGPDLFIAASTNFGVQWQMGSGGIQDLRIIKGSANRTSNFTPPAAPFPNL